MRVFRFLSLLTKNGSRSNIESARRTLDEHMGGEEKRRRRRERTVVEVVVEMMRCCGDVFVAYHLASFSATRFACVACVFFTDKKEKIFKDIDVTLFDSTKNAQQSI